MKIAYQYYKNEGYVISRPSGILTLQDVKDYAEALTKDESITQAFMEVVDFEGVEGFDFGYFEAEELVAPFKNLKALKGYQGSCLVVKKHFTKSMSNILRNASKDVGVVIRTFGTVEDACRYAQFSSI